MRRPPTDGLVVDSNIVVSAVFGRKSGRALTRFGEFRHLITTEAVRDEALRVIQRLGSPDEESAALGRDYFDLIDVRPTREFASLIPAAARTLRFAVASRNGSERDAHVLALAWMLDADIWSHDRDFAGTGWPSWSSANLAAALGPEPELA